MFQAGTVTSTLQILTYLILVGVCTPPLLYGRRAKYREVKFCGSGTQLGTQVVSEGTVLPWDGSEAFPDLLLPNHPLPHQPTF